MRNVIVFNIITELSEVKYFSKETIKNCIASVCHKMGVKVSDIDQDAVIADVEHAFSSIV